MSSWAFSPVVFALRSVSAFSARIFGSGKWPLVLFEGAQFISNVSIFTQAIFGVKSTWSMWSLWCFVSSSHLPLESMEFAACFHSGLQLELLMLSSHCWKAFTKLEAWKSCFVKWNERQEKQICFRWDLDFCRDVMFDVCMFRSVSSNIPEKNLGENMRPVENA